MMMVDVGHVAAYTGGLNAQVGWFGRRVAVIADLHSSDEPGELSQWL